MIDPSLIRNDPEKVRASFARRGLVLELGELEHLATKRGCLIQKADALRHRRKILSETIGKARMEGKAAKRESSEVSEVKRHLEALDLELAQFESDWIHRLMHLPNLPHESVPDGADSDANREERRVGEFPAFDFEPKDHVHLGEALELMDFTAAARISGARFVVIRDALARLHRALGQFMLDLHTDVHGYIELNVPAMVMAKAMEGTGQLPKFCDDLYTCEDGLYLVPTAEVPVTNLVRGVILEPTQLPLRYVSHTPCYRREAGSHGKDTRGMIRMHQFEKVELVQIVRPVDSYAVLERLTMDAEEVLKRLQLPYRVVSLCAGDLGFSAAKSYDLEVWLPGQGCYREISSCSNFEAFQARRMQARWRNPDSGRPELVHTLNGSGLAIGRTLVAVMENGQQADGSIRVPEVLRPYMGGITRIAPAS